MGFQDAFAHAHANHAHTHYVSVNIGVVSVEAHGALKEPQGGETSISSMRAGLRQNSVMDISFEEFFADIEYAMTPLARDNKLNQTIQGVTHQSMLDANDEHLLENRIFSQLVSAQEKQATGATRADKIDIEKALSGVKSMEEAEQLIRDATLSSLSSSTDPSTKSGSTSRCPLSASTLSSASSSKIGWCAHSRSTCRRPSWAAVAESRR